METQTLAGIVTELPAAAIVFDRFSLDFCCQGKRSLGTACLEQGINTAAVLAELQSVATEADGPAHPETMSTAALIELIVARHHAYVRQSAPAIYQRLQKVAGKHGSRFPYLEVVLEKFIVLANELDQHMQKEEQILFPGMLAGQAVQGPIAVMEAEHADAGRLTSDIRQLTGQYTAPEQACTTFRLVLDELGRFEEDLHQHIHLENNILFPRAFAG